MKILDSWCHAAKEKSDKLAVLSQELDSKLLELKNFWIASFTAAYIEHRVQISVTEQFPSNFYLWWTLCIGLHSVCTVINCYLSLCLNVGGLREGPGKRFDGPVKVLEFFVCQ